MVSLHEEEEPNGRLKRNQRGAKAPHLSEPQKAHPTGEFVVVA